VLKIQGDTVWWEHHEWAAPGLWEHGPVAPPLPTRINGNDWYPYWATLGPYGFCPPDSNCNYSSNTVSGLLPALAAKDQTLQLVLLDARTPVLVDNPSAANGYTASILFDDEFAGAEWYRVALTYETSAVPVPAAAWLFGSAIAAMAGLRKRRSGR